MAQLFAVRSTRGRVWSDSALMEEQVDGSPWRSP